MNTLRTACLYNLYKFAYANYPTFLYSFEDRKNLKDTSDMLMWRPKVLKRFFFVYLFISIFISLTRRKPTEAVYIRAITMACFRRCQDIDVLLKFFIHFILSLYLLLDSKKSDEGANTWESNYPDLLPKMLRYGCPIEIFYFGFLVLRRYD